MAHFKAYFDAMTESTSNNDAVNMKIMTITLQSEANGIFGKEKVTQKRTGERKRAVSKKVTQQNGFEKQSETLGFLDIFLTIGFNIVHIIYNICL